MCRLCSSGLDVNGAMIGAERIGFDPALPISWLIVLGLLALASWGVYVWRRGGAPILRIAGLAFVMLGLLQPQWVREAREAANDVALLLVDRSESLALAGRAEAVQRASDAIAEQLAAEQGLEVRVREARGGPDGTAIAAPIE